MSAEGTLTLPEARNFAYANQPVNSSHAPLLVFFQDRDDPNKIIGFKGGYGKKDRLTQVSKNMNEIKDINELRDYMFTLLFEGRGKSEYLIQRSGGRNTGQNEAECIYSRNKGYMSNYNCGHTNQWSTTAYGISMHYDIQFRMVYSDPYHIMPSDTGRRKHDFKYAKILPLANLKPEHFGKNGFNVKVNLESVIDGGKTPPSKVDKFSDTLPLAEIPWKANCSGDEDSALFRMDDDWGLSGEGGTSRLFPGAFIAFPIHGHIASACRGLHKDYRGKHPTEVLDYNVIYTFDGLDPGDEPAAEDYKKLLNNIKGQSEAKSRVLNKTLPVLHIIEKLCAMDDHFLEDMAIETDMTEGGKNVTTCMDYHNTEGTAAEETVKETCLANNMKKIADGYCTINKLQGIGGSTWAGKMQNWVDEYCSNDNMDNQVKVDQCGMHAVNNITNAVAHCRESNITSNTCTTIVGEYDSLESDYATAMAGAEAGSKTLSLSGGKDAWLAVKGQINLYSIINPNIKVPPADFVVPSMMTCEISNTFRDQSGGELNSECNQTQTIEKIINAPPAPADDDDGSASIETTTLETSAEGDGEGSASASVNKDGEKLSSSAATGGGTGGSKGGGAKPGTDTTADSEWNATTLAMLCFFLMVCGMGCCAILGIGMFAMSQ